MPVRPKPHCKSSGQLVVDVVASMVWSEGVINDTACSEIETPEEVIIGRRGTATIHVKMGHFALGKQAKDLSRQH